MARVITSASYSKHSADIWREPGWLSLREKRQHHMALVMFKPNHSLCPSYLSDVFDINTSWLSYDFRSSRMNLIVPKARTNYFRNSFASAGAKLWNSIPASLKERLLLNNLRQRSGCIYCLHKHHNFSFIIRFNIVCDLFLV